VVLDPARAEPQRPDAGRLKVRIAPAVALKRPASAMRPVGVDFDGEALLVEEQVDLPTTHADVRLRLGQLGEPRQPQRLALGAAAGTAGVAGDGAAQRGDAGATAERRRLDLGSSYASEVKRSGARRLELVRRL
jgi:hypothetical protein